MEINLFKSRKSRKPEGKKMDDEIPIKYWVIFFVGFLLFNLVYAVVFLEIFGDFLKELARYSPP